MKALYNNRMERDMHSLAAPALLMPLIFVRWAFLTR